MDAQEGGEIDGGFLKNDRYIARLEQGAGGGRADYKRAHADFSGCGQRQDQGFDLPRSPFAAAGRAPL